MTYKELQQKHYDIHFGSAFRINPPVNHRNLSIEFAISVLEKLHEQVKTVGNLGVCNLILAQIQILKQSLNEES